MQTFGTCKHLERAKFLVVANFGTCETLGTCELVVVQNFWHVGSFGTWFKIWDVEKFWHVQNLGRAKVLARAKVFSTCKNPCNFAQSRDLAHYTGRRKAPDRSQGAAGTSYKNVSFPTTPALLMLIFCRIVHCEYRNKMAANRQKEKLKVICKRP